MSVAPTVANWAWPSGRSAAHPAGHGLRLRPGHPAPGGAPTFGSKWLQPRLGDFYAAHPGMLVHLHSRIQAVDFAASEIDAAISVAAGTGRGCVSIRCKPSTCGDRQPGDPGELPDATPATLADQLLLGVANNPQAWGEWFRHHELPHRRCAGAEFRADIAPHPGGTRRHRHRPGAAVLVEDELAQGELLACGPALVSRRSYYLVYPPRNEGCRRCRPFGSGCWPRSMKERDSHEQAVTAGTGRAAADDPVRRTGRGRTPGGDSHRRTLRRVAHAGAPGPAHPGRGRPAGAQRSPRLSGAGADRCRSGGAPWKCAGCWRAWPRARPPSVAWTRRRAPGWKTACAGRSAVRQGACAAGGSGGVPRSQPGPFTSHRRGQRQSGHRPGPGPPRASALRPR